MIPRSADWKNALARAVRDPAELLALLELPRELLEGARWGDQAFALRVPRSYVAKMAKSDPADPLLRQVLPLGEERRPVPGFVADPVGDLQASTVPGLLQKYAGRALLVATGACAIHCRYCFRRHFPYADENPARSGWEEALDHLAADSSIHEVILSGGDPLLLDDGRLAGLSRRLDAIAHLRRLRIHTRLPVVLPERVDSELLEWLKSSRLKPILVIHANHANEFDADVYSALGELRRADVTLLNQTVLLAGVNDSVEALTELSEVLFDAGVLPYYLHLLDKVDGAAHFQVDEQRALALMAAIRTRLPGYLVPKLVREVAGEPFKRPIA
jgi:EF-P beta-lysylation protein EpmB